MFEELVAHCPLSYDSNNAPSKRDVLRTILLSALQVTGATRTWPRWQVRSWMRRL